jgi:class 3 adenylate cyclase
MQAQVLHDKCLRERMHECYGYEVHTEGDSFTVAFHEAEDALRWCSSVQTSLHYLAWPSVFIPGQTPPAGAYRRRSLPHCYHYLLFFALSVSMRMGTMLT